MGHNDIYNMWHDDKAILRHVLARHTGIPPEMTEVVLMCTVEMQYFHNQWHGIRKWDWHILKQSIMQGLPLAYDEL